MSGTPTGTVVDLAYGEGSPAVAELLERIDDPRRPSCPVGAGAAVIHPTTWGRRRVAALLSSVGAAQGIPRAVAVARSHADATVNRCAVVETCLLPDTGGHWSVHVVRRCAGEWIIDSGLVDLPADAPIAWRELLESVDVVVIDGADDRQVTAALGALPSPPGGALRAERDLVARHGGVRPSIRESIDSVLRPPPQPSSTGRRTAVIAFVGALIVAGGAWVALHGRPSQAQSVTTQQVDRIGVDVPSDWVRTDLADDRPVDGAGTRAVFADPDDGARIVVVVTPLRAGSTRGTVAVSLRNRLAQRGDDVIREFAADASFGGHQVISYRETPASGPPIAWYVHVDGAVQVSVGCQRGTGDEAVDEPCETAVRTLRTLDA